MVPWPCMVMFLTVLTPPPLVFEGTLVIQIDCAISAMLATDVPNWRLLAVTQAY